MSRTAPWSLRSSGTKAAAERAPLARPQLADRLAVDQDGLGPIGQRPRRTAPPSARSGRCRRCRRCRGSRRRRRRRQMSLRSVPNCWSEASAESLHDEARALALAWRRRPWRRRLQLAADHQLRQLLGRLAPRIAFGDDAAQPHDRRPVAERLDLLQLVADVEDRAALAGQPPQGREQLRSPPAASAPRSARP